MSFKHLIAAAIVNILLLACSSSNNIEIISEVQRRLDLAQSLSDQQRYYEALLQIEIADDLLPSSELVQFRKTTLEKLISDKKNKLLKQYAKASKFDEQVTILFKALALDPHDGNISATLSQLYSLQENTVLVELQRNERNALLEQEKALIELQNFVKTQEIDPAFEEIKQLVENGQFDKLAYKFEMHINNETLSEDMFEYLAKTCLKLGDQYKNSGNNKAAYDHYSCFGKTQSLGNQELLNNLKSIKRVQSEALFADAMKIFRTDIEKSVQLLEKSVDYDNNNLPAKRQLNIGKKILTNLRKITEQE